MANIRSQTENAELMRLSFGFFGLVPAVAHDPIPVIFAAFGKGVAFDALFRYPAAMAIDPPSNVTSIKQAARRRAKAQRQNLIRRILPYLVIFTVAGIGGVASLKSMPGRVAMPGANADHRP